MSNLPPATDSKRLLTSKDICARLGISEAALDEMIREGRFPRGRAISQKASFWTLEDFEAYVLLANRWHPERKE